MDKIIINDDDLQRLMHIDDTEYQQSTNDENTDAITFRNVKVSEITATILKMKEEKDNLEEEIELIKESIRASKVAGKTPDMEIHQSLQSKTARHRLLRNFIAAIKLAS